MVKCGDSCWQKSREWNCPPGSHTLSYQPVCILIIVMMIYADWLKKHWKSKNYEATPYAKPDSFLENEDSEAVNPFQFDSFVHYSFVGKSWDICQADDIYINYCFHLLLTLKWARGALQATKKPTSLLLSRAPNPRSQKQTNATEEVTELLTLPSPRYPEGNRNFWMLTELWMVAFKKLIRAMTRGLYMTNSAVSQRTPWDSKTTEEQTRCCPYFTFRIFKFSSWLVFPVNLLHKLTFTH